MSHQYSTPLSTWGVWLRHILCFLYFLKYYNLKMWQRPPATCQLTIESDMSIDYIFLKRNKSRKQFL